jgi:hypothetical chaperone protein
MAPACCGIDFGTSNSTVGILADGQPQLIALEGADTTVPSAVFFNFEDNHTYFGRRAIADYTDNAEGRLLRALKSVLGSSLIHDKTRVKARSIAFSEIIGSFIGFLKTQLDASQQSCVGDAVLGRPVQFVDDDPAADRAAQDELEKIARAQGFKHIEFQYEPIAAALDYEQSVKREELALIVDIGGGTSDFSIVRVSPEGPRKQDRKQDILANAGVHVGGTDFDKLLSMASVMRELGYLTLTKDGKRNLPAGYFFDLATWQRINLLYTPKAMAEIRQMRYEAAHPELVARMIDIVVHRQGHALASSVEQAKIDLTSHPAATIRLALADDDLAVPVTRATFDEAVGSAVDRICSTVLRTLDEARVPASRIDTVFLTGGSTAVPLLHAGIAAMFPAARFVQGDMFGSVGLGLALDAGRKFGRVFAGS